MKTPINILEYLGTDLGVNILTRLDDPSELACASAVARFWRNFVITNGLFKQFCLKMFPQLHNMSGIVETKATKTNNSNNEWIIVERDHKVFAYLLEAVSRAKIHPRLFKQKKCIATSTNSYRDEDDHKSAYSGSKRGAPPISSPGQSDPNIIEIITYKMGSDISIISDIGIRLSKEDWEEGCPLCSAKSVRIRTGHAKSQKLRLWAPDEYNFVWTYISPEFPLKKESCMQIFELPEPVLCVGGILQMELLGRVHRRRDTNPLFYKCMGEVELLGFPMESQFNIEFLKPYCGEFLLKYRPECFSNDE